MTGDGWTIPRDAHLAERIAARHTSAVRRVDAVSGRGTINHVFVVTTDTAPLVVRFTVDPHRPDVTAAEAWAATRAAEHGVPTPRIIAHDRLDGVPYLVQEFVAGKPASDDAELWRTLGRYAQRIGAIDVPADGPASLFSRFGPDLPGAWAQHVAYNLDELTDADPLLGLGVYDRSDQPRLRERIAPLAGHRGSFGLAHGDLAARNVLMGADGTAVLLDWETATTGPAPWTDVCAVVKEHLLTGRPAAREVRVFLKASGVDGPDDRATISAMLVLGALDLVRWARDRRPDRLADVVRDARRILARPTYCAA